MGKEEIPDVDMETELYGGSGGKDGASFREIVMTQYQRCVREGSKEMHEGGIQIRTVNGVPMNFIVPNQIDIFCNSVKILFTTLKPKIMTHKKKVEKRFDDATDKGRKVEEEYNKRIEDINKWRKEKIRPKKGPADSYNRSIEDERNKEIELAKKTKQNKLLEAYIELFEAITFLLELMNYMEEGIGGM